MVSSPSTDSRMAVVSYKQKYALSTGKPLKPQLHCHD